MDNFDARILQEMQRSNLIPAETIANTVGLSVSAVQRRIKRLRTDGAIEADISVVAPHAVGQQMTFVVAVEMERERADLIDAFKRQMRLSPHVQQCYYITGESDFIIVMTAASMDEYEGLTRELFFDNSNVRRFHTNVVMQRVKVGLSVHIEA
jgi:DNA-binding Lrp family transcriptional regulator